MAIWLRTHRHTVAMAALLAFAGPLTFFTGALGVMRTPTFSNLALLGFWWTMYGALLWCLLLLTGYGCERLVGRPGRPGRPGRLGRLGRHGRAGLWLLAACAAAALANALTAGRATMLMQQGLIHSPLTMHLHGFTVALVMALLYFAYLRRSQEHAQASERLAGAQRAQRLARSRMVQARLEEVHARIDPRVLFELLDSVRDLYQRDSARAEHFLDELIVFLRTAVPRLRSASSSLVREVELARGLVRLRGLARKDHLELKVAIAPEVMHARFPPGVLMPLLDHIPCGGSAPPGLTATRSSGSCRVALRLAAAPCDESVARVEALLSDLHGSASSLRVERSDGASEVIVEVPYELA